MRELFSRSIYTLKSSLSFEAAAAGKDATTPPLPVPPFQLTQNLSPKDTAGYNIMKLQVL